MNAPAALYWYHQQPGANHYRNSSASNTGPWTSSNDPTGQPGVFNLVKYVPETAVAAAVAAEREACADLVRQLRDSIRELSHGASAAKGALYQTEQHIRARGEKGGAAC